MRTFAPLLLVLCVAAGPATKPTTKQALAPETREREGKITVDAVKGGDARLRVVKGDVYTLDASGEWTNGLIKPFGPEGRPQPKGFVPNSANVDLHALDGWFNAPTFSNHVEVGKKTRWTAPADGFFVLSGLERTGAKEDKREGHLVVKFRRVITGKEQK